MPQRSNFVLAIGAVCALAGSVRARPTENIAEPTFDAALQAANLTLDRLDQVWQTWVKSLK